MRVSERLDKYNVRRKISKCAFFKDSIDYLGQVISNSTKAASPKKVAPILIAKVPTTKKETRSFLGMINYYFPFIPNVSSVTKPLRELTELNTDFTWNPVNVRLISPKRF